MVYLGLASGMGCLHVPHGQPALHAALADGTAVDEFITGYTVKHRKRLRTASLHLPRAEITLRLAYSLC